MVVTTFPLRKFPFNAMYYLGRRENKLIYVKAIIVRVNFESLYGKYADTYETFLSLRENSAPHSPRDRFSNGVSFYKRKLTFIRI